MRIAQLVVALVSFATTGCTEPIRNGHYGCNPEDDRLGARCPSGYSCYVAPGDEEPRCWRGEGVGEVDAGPPPSFLRVEVTRPGINEDEVAEGVQLFLDAPDGMRQDLETAANGAATFEGLTWGSEAYALTAVLPGHRVETRVARSPAGFGAPDGTLRLRLELAPASETRYPLELSIRDAPEGEMDLYLVTTRRAGTAVSGDRLPITLTMHHAGDRFANDFVVFHYYEQTPMPGMSVRRQVVQAMVENHRDPIEGPEPISRETVYGGAVGTTEVERASASLEIPTWLDDMGDVRLDVTPTTLDSEGELRLGMMTALSRQEGTRELFYDLAFVQPSFLGTGVTLVEARVGTEGRFSALVEPAPVAGMPSPTRQPSFLRWPSRAGGDSVDAPLSFVTTEGETIVRLRRIEDGLAVWDVVLERGSTELRWPALSEEGASVVGPGPWRGQLFACDGRPAFRRGRLCERVAGSEHFDVTGDPR